MRASGAPVWASSVGIVAVLLGVFSTAWHANEWLKFVVVATPPYSIATMPEPDCDEGELEEEGLTLEECYQLAFVVHDISISSPDWFKSFHIGISIAGTALALASILIGIALVDYRPWAAAGAVAVFGAFTALDIISFIAVVNTGPLVRQTYLWLVLLWFFLHFVLTVAAWTGRRHEETALKPSAAAWEKAP